MVSVAARSLVAGGNVGAFGACGPAGLACGAGKATVLSRVNPVVGWVAGVEGIFDVGRLAEPLWLDFVSCSAEIDDEAFMSCIASNAGGEEEPPNFVKCGVDIEDRPPAALPVAGPCAD